MNPAFMVVIFALVALVTSLWVRMKSAEERIEALERKLGSFWQATP